jgi:hypothetical protein
MSDSGRDRGGGVVAIALAKKGKGVSVESEHPLRRRAERTVAGLLWFPIEDGWTYYLILAGYSVIVGGGVWLLTRQGWLRFLLGCAVLLDGVTAMLFLLYWLWMRRLRARWPQG